MALRIWLPLNGSLENKGISDITVTNNGATVDNNGKIGKCYSFNGSSNRISCSTVSYGYPCSFAAWIYPTDVSRTNTQYILSYNTDSGGTAGHALGIGFYQNNILQIWAGGGNYSSSTALSNNTWYHIAATIDSNKKYSLYINGELKVSGTCGNHPGSKWITIGARSNSSTGGVGGASYHFQGKINDVRFYDHCLSAKEVKEISQGLILHYKLDGWCGGVGENLYNGTKDFSGSWDNGSSWTVSTEKYNGFTVKEKSSEWGGLAQKINCIQNDIFTISFYAKVENGGTLISIHRSNLGNVTTGLQILNGNFSGGSTTSGNWVTASENGTAWKRYWATVKIIQNDITYLQWRIENSISNKKLSVAGFKLERGDKATNWCPAISEMGIDTTKIKDSSGYENDLIIKNDITITSNSIRYNTKSHFINGSYAISPKASNSYLPTDGLTVNLWIYCTTWGNPISCTEGGGWNFENSSGVQFPVYISGVGYKVANSGVQTSTLLNSWHMLTGTFDKTNVKIYINGILKATTATGSTNGIGYAGNGLCIAAEANGTTTSAADSSFTGDISDVRVYATALSAEDILELYNTPANIDNLGNLHGFELEDKKNNILFPVSQTLVSKDWNASVLLKGYTQTNCQVTLTDDGLRIYRPANYNQTNNGSTMWGGMRLANTLNGGKHVYNTNDNPMGLQKNHTYIIYFKVKGKSSNANSNYGWTNQMGWGGGGLQPTPSDVEYDLIPANFNGEKICWYKWTINDEVVKTCTTSYSYATQGNQYMSYADFAFGWGYQDTGTMGTDIYITDIQMYDITDDSKQSILENGTIQTTAFWQENISNNLHFLKGGLINTNNIVEK